MWGRYLSPVMRVAGDTYPKYSQCNGSIYTVVFLEYNTRSHIMCLPERMRVVPFLGVLLCTVHYITKQLLIKHV